MHILLDECLDIGLRHRIPDHVVQTVQYCGWKGKRNGDLLRAAQECFDVLITVDSSIPNQQYLAQFDLALIVIQTGSSDPDLIERLFERISELLDKVEKGKVLIIKDG